MPWYLSPVEHGETPATAGGYVGGDQVSPATPRPRVGIANRLGLLALSLVAVGCSVGLLPFADGTAPPPPPTRPAATAVRSVVPAQTVAATLVATPAASTAPAETTSFSAFRKHVKRSAKAAKPIFGDKARIRNAGPAGLTRLISDGRKWAEAEMAWLAAHAPRECYRGFFDEWQRGIGVVAEGLTALDNGIADHDVAEASRGLKLLESLDGFETDAAFLTITCTR
jgi:hypothetical protein